MTRTAERLTALAAQLGETPGQVAVTLDAELHKALRDIDAGLAARDADAVSRATHAARNSVLMLDERDLLAALRRLSDATQRGDEAAITAARAQVGARWRSVQAELQAS